VTNAILTQRELPVLAMDHVMVLLDQATYQDVVDAEFLGTTFARRKHKQADSSIAGSYATLGLAGESTLIEFFGSTMPSSSPLTGGLVFSFERPGSSASARALLDQARPVGYHYDLVRRSVAGADESQPWYHLINVDLGVGSPLVLFLNEVTPEYFAAIGARPSPAGDLCRRNYLDAALGESHTGDRLLRDIVGVTLAVGHDRARSIAAALTRFGFVQSENADGIELVGPELTLRLRVPDHSVVERVTEIHLRLAGASVGEFRFGSASRLVIDSAESARWVFGQLG
jgi:hypothetical protein